MQCLNTTSNVEKQIKLYLSDINTHNTVPTYSKKYPSSH